MAMARPSVSSLRISLIPSRECPGFVRFVITDANDMLVETSRFAYAEATGAQVAAETRVALLEAERRSTRQASRGALDSAEPFSLSAA
jgi:hypothetical protein